MMLFLLSSVLIKYFGLINCFSLAASYVERRAEYNIDITIEKRNERREKIHIESVG